eukprot:CAMPEP_0205926738 /NCGR_PEP_ID=MMETSP1325-20131115/21125_1 /ASSEMBLY_ACC=CAM_ASM_000708 /TAXON_ID=236786 /ORGANISM="Florenciella sp., Strain RCC1007" /LENGTH=44 /DNA_ID= /DNA_START= /DNA_END= /DNA_ORIENTATION=
MRPAVGGAGTVKVRRARCFNAGKEGARSDAANTLFVCGSTAFPP